MSNWTYPSAICAPCGEKVGRRQPMWAAWWPGTCGWCGKETTCTKPRDFGHPSFPASEDTVSLENKGGEP